VLTSHCTRPRLKIDCRAGQSAPSAALVLAPAAGYAGGSMPSATRVFQLLVRSGAAAMTPWGQLPLSFVLTRSVD
jgi:hypothetical protein